MSGRTGSGRRRSRRVLAGVAAAALSATTAGALLGATPSQASSHREAPGLLNSPLYDNTDVYAFVSPENDGTITVIADWIPFEEPAGGPNFYPFATDAYYDINFDANGDGQAEKTYRWKFDSSYQSKQTFLYNTGPVTTLTDADLNFRQHYTLTEVKPNRVSLVAQNVPVAPSRVGDVSMPDYAGLRRQAVKTYADPSSSNIRLQTFAGQAEDPFFLDLRVFDLLYGPKKTSSGTTMTETGKDSLRGFNVNTIAFKVPMKEIALNHDPVRNPVLGIWSTTSRINASGKPVQVSRLGNPLVNEVVLPVALKDAFNSIPPSADHTVGAAVNSVLHPEVPKLIEAIYGVPAPAGDRQDLFEVFLNGVCKACGPVKADLNSQKLNKDVQAGNFVPAEELRLNMAVKSHANPNRLGVLGGDTQGFPNGRRLTDDVLDIELQALEGALAPYGRNLSGLGDGVNSNDRSFSSTFPYVGLPFSGSDPNPHS